MNFYYKDKIVKKMSEDAFITLTRKGAEVVNTCFGKIRNSKKREFDTLLAFEEYIASWSAADGVLALSASIGCFSFSRPDGSFCWHRDQCLYPADIGVVVGAVAAGEVMDELINESEFGYLDGWKEAAEDDEDEDDDAWAAGAGRDGCG